jgi:hypothetical protein
MLKYIFTSLIVLIAGAAFSQSQQILLLDDFEGYPLNSFDLETGTFGDTLGSSVYSLVLRDFDAFCHSGKSLLVNYSLVNDSTAAVGYLSALPVVDLNNYHYLSFWVKSAVGLDMIFVELERTNGERSKVGIWNYLSCGPSQEWQKVIIPLDAFWNLTDRSNILKFVLSFEGRLSAMNGSPLSSEVYFDEILFGTFFPGYVKLDPFNDLLPGNATGANNGSFAPSGNPDNYNNVLLCDNFPQNDCDCYLRLNFDHSQEDEFGGYFAILGGGTTGFETTPQPFNEYDSLSFTANAVNNITNPGNFKVELKEDDTNFLYTQVLGIETEEKTFSVALSDFNVQGSPTTAGQLTIVFEKGVQEVLTGSVVVDEILLKGDQVNLPDEEQPEEPGLVALNGAPVSDFTWLMPNTNVSLSITVDGGHSKLETVRLEYFNTCDWICLEKVYAPFGPDQAVVDFSTSDIPNNLELDMRVVAQHYNGVECSSDVFTVFVDDPENAKAQLFKNAFDLFQILRAETGVYLDAIVLDDNVTPYHPASVATTGMGLISLCIGDAMGWIDNAEDLALETLKNMNGLRADFNPARNCKGWFRHFIDEVTGQAPEGWESEFSSIDSGILAAGGLFCKQYFSNNDSIALLADALYSSIDWASTIADPQTGAIYRECNEDGVLSGITLPYNEYMIVAWLAKNYYRDNELANELWDNHYASPESLPKSTYSGIDVLTDFPGNFLPDFIPQFNYFLCNYFTASPAYFTYFQNSMEVDISWWRDHTDALCTIWGYGAGSSCVWASSGYHADNINEHPGTICSPHIIGGFIPANPALADDLINLQIADLGTYDIPFTDVEVLWRFSHEDPTWEACDLQGIDFSTLLFGLASHPDFLGTSFFEAYNDFDFPDANSTNLSPVIDDNFPQSIVLEACWESIVTLDYVSDLNHPSTLLQWEVVNNQNVNVNFDTPCEIEFSIDSTFIGEEEITLLVTDPEGASDTLDVLIAANDSCMTVSYKVVPRGLELKASQNYPNPFSDFTIINFEIARKTSVLISIFNASGNLIFDKKYDHLIPGTYDLVWHGRNEFGKPIPPGAYYYSIQTDNQYITKKIILGK